VGQWEKTMHVCTEEVGGGREGGEVRSLHQKYNTQHKHQQHKHYKQHKTTNKS